MTRQSGPPDWAAIFAKRPELQPPGYLETVADMKARPKHKPKGKSKGKR